MPILSGLRGWINGGAGIVVSAALARQMNSGQCLSWYPGNWRYGQNAADVVFACCVMDYWQGGSISHHPGFFREGPGPRQHECECNGICTLTPDQSASRPHDVISYHHLSVDSIEVCVHMCYAFRKRVRVLLHLLFCCSLCTKGMCPATLTCLANQRRLAVVVQDLCSTEKPDPFASNRTIKNIFCIFCFEGHN
jgi:hypothetical protein